MSGPEEGPTVKPLWQCTVCGDGIHAYSQYVVLLFSDKTTEREHWCGDCWNMVMDSAIVVLRATGILLPREP